MNSEELEVSLRTEFESYLKSVLAEMKQEISQLQENVTTEIERHKSQLDEVFTSALNNFEKEPELDAGFKESVIEHLRLSRDEGAQITAMAIAKAEELEKENEAEMVPAAGIKEIHQGVSEISSKTTQSEILKTLVHHATNFAPRGAFFIVKNEHLVGWRVFGKEKGSSEEKVREVYLPVSVDSFLGGAVKSLTTVSSSSGGFVADAEVLEKLEFGNPDRMVAVPLVARGRGVAVLYADYGNEGGDINVEALETLVKVAGLTVEVLASSKSSGKKASSKKTGFVDDEVSGAEADAGRGVGAGKGRPSRRSGRTLESPGSDVPVETVENVGEPAQFVSEVSEAPDHHAGVQANTEFEEAGLGAQSEFENVEYETTPEFVAGETEAGGEFEAVNEPVVTATEYQFETTPAEVQFETSSGGDEEYPAFEAASWTSPIESTPGFSAQEFAQNFAKETDPSEYARDFSYQEESEVSIANPKGYDLEVADSYQDVQTETSTGDFVPTKEQTYGSFETENVTEPISQPAIPPPTKSRLSERNVDLPIEVTEDERRLHNDARRFARLLVSEIKLYNEQKVKEGRDSSDLYERLKEAIDRSREMYDKRVQPPVAAKFDYFHYELVNTLAEGDDLKLGDGYPGSSV